MRRPMRWGRRRSAGRPMRFLHADTARRRAQGLDEVAEAVHRHTAGPADVHGLEPAVGDQLIGGAPADAQGLGGFWDREEQAFIHAPLKRDGPVEFDIRPNPPQSADVIRRAWRSPPPDLRPGSRRYARIRCRRPPMIARARRPTPPYLHRVLIGVDESGDFRNGSRGMFVGVFIRPSEREEFLERYRSWEQRTRRHLGHKNELKGHLVSDYDGRRLFRDVLAYEGRPFVRYLAFAVDVNEPNLAAMEVQRQFFVEDYGAWADDLRARGDAKRTLWVDQHLDWAVRLSPVQLLKLVTLGTVVPGLVEQALPMAILGGFDEELEHLRLLIDRGYVKQDDLPRWRELLRNAVINETHSRPLPLLDTWTDDHPFLKKFVGSRGGRDGPVVLTSAWRDAIDFYDSVGTPEVRVADVVGSLVYRATLKGEKLRSYQLIRGLSLEPDSPYRLFMWTQNRRTRIADPYGALDSGTD